MGSRQRLAPHDPIAPGTRVLAVGCGDARTEVLEVAGYDVARRPCVEFAQLAKTDLLILALMPPEPPTAALVRVLRERSDVRVLALVQGLGASERTAVIEAGAEECLDTSADDAEFLARTRTLLRDHVERVLVDQLG
jgi:DNA-binding response OmpR family regulator